MTKPIIVSANSAANVVVGGDFLEADGSGFVKAYDGAGTILGRAEGNPQTTTKELGCIKQGLIPVATTNDAYNFGDQVFWIAGAGGKVDDGTVGTVLVGRAIETKTTTAADNSLQVYINFA